MACALEEYVNAHGGGVWQRRICVLGDRNVYGLQSLDHPQAILKGNDRRLLLLKYCFVREDANDKDVAEALARFKMV